ncbi:MAG: antitoxin [Actinomycetota bacterium]|nr:antitoxin [Actinomycetota bacterium]
MRTTLALDDDVLLAIKERARQQHRTAGAVLSELARLALTQLQPAAGSTALESFYGFEPFPPRGPIVTNELIDQLRDEESM